jgi:mannosyltransferase OCH1-like enzyme
MIPNIIHQTWKTKDLPDNLKKLQQKIINLHPHWDIKLWTDEENLALVEEHFPHLLPIYNALEYNIMRADIIRYMYMFKYGGYYLDLDYEVFVPFDDQTSEPDLMLPVSGKENGQIIIGNSIFGSVPGHVFWKDVLEDFQYNPPTQKFFNKFEVLKLTGPDFISRIYSNNSQKYNGFLVEKNVYHPDNTLVNTNNYQQILQDSGSRGIHHCNGSWLKEDNSLIHLISRANSSAKRRIGNFLKKANSNISSFF